MENDTRPQEEIGIARVAAIVQGRAGQGWQPFNSRNDNGIDGIIIERKKTKGFNFDKGNIIYVQVKCGDGYYTETAKRPDHFGVNLSAVYISTHRPRWNRLPGGVIAVYVDYITEKAWWTDLKDESSYSTENKQIILFPKNQRFGIHSFGNFKKLSGYVFIDPEVTTIKAEKNDLRFFNFTESSAKSWARAFYKDWCASNDTVNPTLGPIIVSREGWRHISRKGRNPERILNSWSLLGVAKKIIQQVGKIYQLRYENAVYDKSKDYVITDFISLRAQVVFPYRHTSIVQVILKRKRKFNSANEFIESKIWFYSLYEPLTGKPLR